MSSGTPTNILGLHKYASTDDLDYREINTDNDLLDTIPPTVCTSTTRPTTNKYQGRLIYETDTGAISFWDVGSNKWIPFANGTPWLSFTPKGYKDAGATSVAVTGVTGKYQVTGKVCNAWVELTFTNATTGGAAVDLPLTAKDRLIAAGPGGLYGAGTPADQCGTISMTSDKTKVQVIAYTAGFRDAAAGNTLRYNVTYELP